MMRALLWVTGVLAALWGGYWVVGSRAALSGAEAWLNGSNVVYQDVSVAGFPNRFDVTVTGVSVVDTASDVGWSAPFVQVFAMGWKPWHLIAALPNEQEITFQDQRVSVESARMMGSLLLVPGADFALSETVAEGEGLALHSSLGWQVAADKAVLSTRATGQGNDHRFGLAVTRIAPGTLAQDTGLPAVIDAVRVDAVLGFSAPLDGHAGQTMPQVISVDLTEARLDWGDLELVATGQIAPDAAGFAAGEVVVQVTGWQALPGALRALGLIEPEFEPKLMQGLTLMSGGKDSVSVKVRAQGGQLFTGPLPLGPAPYFGVISTN